MSPTLPCPKVINATPSSFQLVPVTGRGAGGWGGMLTERPWWTLGQGQPPVPCSVLGRAWVGGCGGASWGGVQGRPVFRGSQNWVESTCLCHRQTLNVCLDLGAGSGNVLLSPVFCSSLCTLLNKLKGIDMQVGFGLRMLGSASEWPPSEQLHRE